MSDLIGLERAVYHRRPDAVAALRELLLGVATGKFVVDRKTSEQSVELTPALCTRAAAAVATFLLDPGSAFSGEDFARLAVLHGAINNLFAASGFGSADHALALLPAPAELRSAADRQAYLRFWALFGLDSGVEVELRRMLAAPPDLALLTFLQLLATKPVGTLKGHAARDRLLELAPMLPAGRVPATADHIVLLARRTPGCCAPMPSTRASITSSASSTRSCARACGGWG